MFSGGGKESAVRQAVLACQVCSQDQTLADEEGRGDEAYIMECCFSIVCKECVGVTGSANQSAAPSSNAPDSNTELSQIEEQTKQAPRTSRICLACLEPSTAAGKGTQPLSLEKYKVLVSLLSSINEAQKKAAMRRDSSSIFNFITGSGQAHSTSKLCDRCQLHDYRYMCQTCAGSGGVVGNEALTATKLCEQCHTLIHSLGSAFKSHKVFERQAPPGNQSDLRQVGVESEDQLAEKELLLPNLRSLQECALHGEPIEFYLEEDVPEDASLELPAVSYACHRCVSGAGGDTLQGMTKIDKENLLNVYSLKQELFKERQKSQATLNSMLANFNLDIVEKLPELRRLETQQVADVITRVVKTLYNKQREVEQQIEDKFQKLADHVHKEKQRMLTKKDVIDRNYNLLEKALEAVPLQILSCEEGLLEAVLMANQGLMKVVRGQEAKLLQRQAQLFQPETGTQAEDSNLDAPFHLIQPEQQKQRLAQLEYFAIRLDNLVSELFKQASEQLETPLKTIQTTLVSNAASPRGLEASAPQAYQTSSFPLNSQDTNAGMADSNAAMTPTAQNSANADGKRPSTQSTRNSVLAAFVTQQNQAKPRMSRDNLTKSHLSIGHHASFNQLDVTQDKKVTDQSRGSGKGGTSRRDASHNVANRNSSQSATAAHQAYLQTASHRYAANAATASKSSANLKTAMSQNNNMKWNQSTRIGQSKQVRDNSVSSQNQPGGQSLPRHVNQGKDRSAHRPSVNTGLRSGAHSAVGQSERWTANTAKRNSNLDTSQEMGAAGDLQNQKNTPGDSSPRLSRNRISMNNIAVSKDRTQVDPEKLVIKENMSIIEQNCLAPRVFTHVAQTSTAIQVAWSHPANFQKVVTVEDENGNQMQRRQHIQYVLEYGIGVKVDNKEQFRQIYKGKAHKCIITDLMPRTTFRLRVAPILNIEQPQPGVDQYQSNATETTDGTKKSVAVVQEQGEWSDVTNITTKETQTFDVGGGQSSVSPKAPNLLCAQIVSRGRKKWLAYEKAGTVMAIYGYSFGEHLWCLKIMYTEQQQSASISQGNQALDQSGSMVVGVVNKRFSNQKMFGSVINYSLFKGEIVVKIYLDSNKKRLIIYSPQHPQGDTFTDLPKDGLFFPAVQNKTSVPKHKSSLRVFYKFEQQIPKDKSEIGSNLVYSSDDGGDNMDESSTYGAPLSTNHSLTYGAAGGHEESKRQDQGRSRGAAQ